MKPPPAGINAATADPSLPLVLFINQAAEANERSFLLYLRLMPRVGEAFVVTGGRILIVIAVVAFQSQYPDAAVFLSDNRNDDPHYGLLNQTFGEDLVDTKSA